MLSQRARSLLVLPIVFLTVVCISTVAYAYVMPVVELRLTTDGSPQVNPVISGTRVVYQDFRNGNADIYLYDLAASTETRLTTDGAAQVNPAMSGTRVVYQDYRNGNDDIYLYDLAAGTETRLTTDGAAQYNPVISGTRVVYQDFRNGNADIYLYDLATGTETRLTTDGAAQYNPAISGTRVVYQDNRNGNADIYLYDLAAGTETRLTTDGAAQAYPAVSGARVVYEDNRNGNADIYLYDLAAGTETRLTTDGSDQNFPAISGTRVVYQDFRNGNADIYLYDLAAGTETRLTTDGSAQPNPAISGTRVLYEDYRNGNWDIYLGELTLPRISVSAPSVVSYGGAAKLTGTLASISGIPVAGRSVALEVSADGVTWTQTSTKVTSSSGAFILVSPALHSARYLRANFKGDGSYPSVQSRAALVKPRASLGVPAAPSTMYRTKTYTVYGALRPRHTSGSSVGRLYCYRWESGRWRLRKTYTLKAYNYSTYSRYRTSVKLPKAGKWRMRAYHSDASHAATYSGWRYTTVK